MKFTLDAENKKIGRLASEAAKLLMGKNTTEYTRNSVPDIHVEIVNANKADVSLKKLEQPLKARFSSFPGGLTQKTVGQVMEKKGKKELFRLAIHGMLPSNKLRSKMMRHLTITE